MATSGDFSWPPAETSIGHQLILSHGHGHLISTAPQSGLITSARFALTVAGRIVDICVTFRDRPATQIPYKLLAC
jgi:hypothetical protein